MGFPTQIAQSMGSSQLEQIESELHHTHGSTAQSSNPDSLHLGLPMPPIRSVPLHPMRLSHVLCMRLRQLSRLLLVPSGPACSPRQPGNGQTSMRISMHNPHHLSTSKWSRPSSLPGCWAIEPLCLRKGPAERYHIGRRRSHKICVAKQWPSLPTEGLPICLSQTGSRLAFVALRMSQESRATLCLLVWAALPLNVEGSCRAHRMVSGRGHVQSGSLCGGPLHKYLVLRALRCSGAEVSAHVVKLWPRTCTERHHSSGGCLSWRRCIGLSTRRAFLWAGALVTGRGLGHRVDLRILCHGQAPFFRTFVFRSACCFTMGHDTLQLFWLESIAGASSWSMVGTCIRYCMRRPSCCTSKPRVTLLGCRSRLASLVGSTLLVMVVSAVSLRAVCR